MERLLDVCAATRKKNIFFIDFILIVCHSHRRSAASPNDEVSRGIAFRAVRCTEKLGKCVNINASLFSAFAPAERKTLEARASCSFSPWGTPAIRFAPRRNRLTRPSAWQGIEIRHEQYGSTV